MTGFTYTSDAAAISAHKHALLETIQEALADDEGRIDIDFGIRWPPINDDSVSVTASRSDPEPVNVGSKRTHWVNISIDVEIYSTRAGTTGEEEQRASDGAFDILRRIDEYIRDGDNITLGGAAQSCFLGATQSAGASEEEDMQRGWRGIGIAATFNTRAYITN